MCTISFKGGMKNNRKKLRNSPEKMIFRNMIRKSAILKLQTPGGVTEGHEQCAAFLENDVKNVLLTDAGLDTNAQIHSLQISFLVLLKLMM
jgi:hypothetical protein